MNSILKTVVCIIVGFASFSVIAYLFFALKDYFRESTKIITALIDFVVTEDTAFELLFVLLIALLIIIIAL